MPKINRPQKNAFSLTIDLEFWWCSEFLKNTTYQDKGDIIQEATHMVLDLLRKYEAAATFFTLGEVAERYPQIIAKIHQEGHEIANHGYKHHNVFEMTPQEFEGNIQRSGKILKSITGLSPKGYRAPNFSFTRKTGWAYDILRNLDYKYSSSLFPFRTKLYGIPEAPLSPYHPSRIDFLKKDDEETFIEFPGTVIKIFSKNVPISGGFYFRILPVSWQASGLNRVLAQRPAMFYLHLRDLYQDIPRVKMPPLAYFFHYYGIKKALRKFEALLQKFTFDTMESTLGLNKTSNLPSDSAT